MAEPTPAPSGDEAQPKAAMNYRLGGDHCHVCMYYTENDGDVERGTCPKVVPHDVAGHDLCDAFARKAGMTDAKPQSADDFKANDLARRGLISDKAMSGMRGRDY